MFRQLKISPVYPVFLFLLSLTGGATAQNQDLSDTQSYVEYKGKVRDSQTREVVEKVQITLDNSTLAGITNSEGEFSLKVPYSHRKENIRFTKVGYLQKSVSLEDFAEGISEVFLVMAEQQLEQIDLYTARNAKEVVRKALRQARTKEQYLTGFYRERISRGSGRDVLLAEAVLQIDEKRKVSGRKGRIDLYKSRKNANYNRLDTTAVKLRGGPYNPLYTDAVKHPDYLFYDDDEFDAYRFEFREPTTLDRRHVFVIYFENQARETPGYYGEIYIDAETNFILKLRYRLNVENRRQAERLLVAKKPRDYSVTPLEVIHEADYILGEENAYLNYAKFFIEIRIKRKGKLFNQRYSVNSEMIITERNSEMAFEEEDLIRFKPTSVIADDVTGFGDPDFWGENNIIEPEKSLERTFRTIWRKYERSQ